MSQVGFTPIQLYRSATAATLPVAGNLAAGELAINTTDEKLYFENTGGTVTLLASSAAAGGTFTTVTATTVVNGLGAVGTPSYTFSGDLNTGMWSPAADTVAVSTAGAERLRIDSAGNVGIGNTAPTSKFQVNGGDGNNIRYDGATDTVAMGVSGGAPFVGTLTNAPLRFLTNVTEKMRIDSSGNVGIGTTAPTSKLDVIGDVQSAGFYRNVNVASVGDAANYVGLGSLNGTTPTPGAAVGAVLNNPATTGSMLFYTRSANTLSERMRITSAGAVAIGTATPGGGLKLDVSGNGRFIGNLDVYNVSGGPVNSGFLNFGSGALSNAAAIYSQTLSGTAGDLILATAQTGTGTITERLRVDSSGNVGIGTTAPVKTLHISNGDQDQARIRIQNTGASGRAYDLVSGINALSQIGFSLYDATANATRLTVDASGNVGIGTTAPTNTLTVQGTVAFNVNSTTDVFKYFTGGAGLVYAGTTTATAIGFITSGGERLRIDSSGNVGVGTSAPSYRLQVNASSGGNQVAYFVNDSAGSTLAGIASSINGGGNNTNSFHFAGVTQTVALWYLYGNGTTSYTSDIRVKKNITTTRDGYLEDVCKLRVVKYNWYNDSDDTPRELGFIAQEVEQVFPGLVQDALHPTKDGEIHKVLKGSVMMPIMLKALQEASAKIDALTARVAQLEATTPTITFKGNT